MRAAHADELEQVRHYRLNPSVHFDEPAQCPRLFRIDSSNAHLLSCVIMARYTHGVCRSGMVSSACLALIENSSLDLGSTHHEDIIIVRL